MRRVEQIWNPMNYTLSKLDYFDLKYDMAYDEKIIANEISLMIELNPKIVAWQSGYDNVDFMMNQFTVRLYLIDELPVVHN